MEALDFAREVWKEFGLNDSFGAGMTLTVDGEVVKQHGKLTNTDDLNEMGDSIVHAKKLIIKLSGPGKS